MAFFCIISFKLNVSESLEFGGTEYGGWTYRPSHLTRNSIVYSVGLGEDISWDEWMMENHDLHVWGYDPTPKSKIYIQSRHLDARFSYTAEGLGTKEGILTFTKPKNPDYVSMRAGKIDGLGATVDVKVNTLENWMERNGHTYLDILKMDIEGLEYDVLEDWIQRKYFPMDQLLVEFHQRFSPDFEDRHEKIISGLKENGFIIIHDNNGQEISFEKVESS
eukprot:GSChrysophyteH1.ASY1.ANO1.454.1 assembled CDS